MSIQCANLCSTCCRINLGVLQGGVIVDTLLLHHVSSHGQLSTFSHQACSLFVNLYCIMFGSCGTLNPSASGRISQSAAKYSAKGQKRKARLLPMVTIGPSRPTGKPAALARTLVHARTDKVR